MIEHIGIGTGIIFYLIGWGFNLNDSKNPSIILRFLKTQMIRVGWMIHTLILGYKAYYGIDWPAQLVPDLLNFVSWASILLLLTARSRMSHFINITILPIFASMLLMLSLSFDSGWTPGIEVTGEHTWKFQSFLLAHIVTLIAGHLLFALACFSSILFLYQEYRLKTKLATVKRQRMPSLSTLRQISYRATFIGFVFLTVGLLLGIMLVDSTHGMNQFGVRRMMSILVWLMYGFFIVEQRVQGYQGKRVAIGSIAGFSMVILAIIIEIYYLQVPAS
ncbi:MAG: cytochrome c biogenesis protein CcsA [SAR324 cluster bacterium]|nr:cytochrome c biogenesis protein CcsA [SAR324 cluster bacterium]